MQQDDQNAATRRVLVVDDDDAYRITLSDVLRSEGFEVVSCMLGREALDLVSTRDFAVAIVDHRLPDSDGTRVLQEMTGLNPRLRGIIHTAYGSFESAKEALNLGTFAYIEKPCEPQEVISHVHRAVATRMAEMLRERDAQLRQSQRLESLGRLASGIAHDFNNLLMAIQGYLDMAKLSVDEEHPAAEALARVEDAARQARGVTGSLLTFSREGVLEKRIVDLSLITRDAARLLRPMLTGKVRLSVSTAEEPLLISADETQVHQVLMNLAMNARDAMPDGGALTIRIGRTVFNDRPAAMLVVTDSGTGMEESVRLRAFEPYFTTKQRGKGTGLGLSIVHAIIEDHGGQVDVWSEPRHGTRVTVALPLTPAAASEAEAKPSGQTRPRPGGAVVLEEDEQIRAVLASMLSHLGFHVFQARTVESAVGAKEEANDDCSLLVVGSDSADRGLDRLRALRETFQFQPALILAAETDDPEMSVEGNQGGPVRILPRPFGLNELEAHIHELASGSEESAS